MHRMLGRMVFQAILLWAVAAAAVDALAHGNGFTVEVEDGRVSIAAKEASSNVVLQELGRKTGFDVAVTAADDRQVNLDLQEASVEAAIQRLSRNYSILFARTEDGGYRVVKVTSVGAGAQGLEAGLTAEQVIKEIRSRNRDVRSYRADVIESVPGVAAGRRVSLLKGEGARFRVEMDLPEGGKYVMLSDGEQMLVWTPRFDGVWRSDLRRVKEELGPEAVRDLDYDWRPPWTFGTDDTPDDSLRYLGMEEIDGRRAYVLEGRTPMARGTNASATSSTQRVWINTRTGFPERAVFYDEHGVETRSQRFANVATNPTWHNNTFRLDVPLGIPTVEATDEHIEMIRQRMLTRTLSGKPPAE